MFKAGFSRADITPPLGSPLAGYFSERRAKTVITPLCLNCIALGDDDKQILIIAADLLNMSMDEAEKIQKMISERTGVPQSRIYMQCLHQHTSIRVGGAPTRSNYFSNKAFLEILYSRYCDVAQLALADMKDATVSYGEKPTERQISFIRRYRMKDGTVRTNPPMQSPDIVAPIGTPDNTVRVFKFAREGADDIALVNFSTHPDVVGHERICADWPGFVRDFTEDRINGVKCILVNGAQGDTNHHDPTKPKNKEADFRLQFSKNMADVITNAVTELWDNTRPVRVGEVFGESQLFKFPTKSDGIENIEQCKKMRAAYLAGDTQGLTLQEIGNISRIAGLDEQPLMQKVSVSTVGFGEVAFVGFSGEPFTEYADVVRSAYPDNIIVGNCLVGGGAGYLPSRQAYDEGGYESMSSLFPKELPSTLQSAATTLVGKYINKTDV